MTRIVLVPGCLALLSAYASLDDPVAGLRAACESAVAWLGRDVRVIAEEQGARVAEELLARRTRHEESVAQSCLVVANGSACRSESAPGYLDERAAPFDESLGTALSGPDPEALSEVDQQVAAQLWATTSLWPRLARELQGARTVAVDFDDAPFGVHYWVMRWQRDVGA